VNEMSKIVAISFAIVLMGSVDPTAPSTLGGFTTATTLATTYQPQVLGYTDVGATCATPLASYIFYKDSVSFGSSQVEPANWYLTGNSLANYAELISPAIDISTITGIKLVDGVSSADSGCIPVTYAAGSFTRSGGAGAVTPVTLDSLETFGGFTTFNTATLYSSLGTNVTAIAPNGTDVYYLVQTSSTTTELRKIDASGTITSPVTLPTAGTDSYPGMTVAGNYLFVLHRSVVSGTAALTVIRYNLSDWTSTPPLPLPSNVSAAKSMISTYVSGDSGFTVYILGTVAARGLIYFTDAFSTVTTARLSTVYKSIAYRKTTIGLTTYGYIYGTYGSASAAAIDEINVASLSTSVVPTSSTAISFIPGTSSINVPNLITWVNEASTFLVSDSETNGALSGGTAYGAIYSYAPTFDAGTGAVSGPSFGSGTLIIRGNSNSGSNELPNTTVIDGGLSNNSSQYVRGTNSLAYRYQSTTGYFNLYIGNGTAGSGTVTGYLIKLYNSWRNDAGDNVGGD
jgi:hypothetical protein